ncbi:hypothetical protein GCM10010381_16430 [Streptomyces xantholiticus]|nr:hypothetical protein GCM10010381_16430 [Streptomyces xantholiticus]
MGGLHQESARSGAARDTQPPDLPDVRRMAYRPVGTQGFAAFFSSRSSNAPVRPQGQEHWTAAGSRRFPAAHPRSSPRTTGVRPVRQRVEQRSGGGVVERSEP